MIGRMTVQGAADLPLYLFPGAYGHMAANDLMLRGKLQEHTYFLTSFFNWYGIPQLFVPQLLMTCRAV